MGGCSQHIVAGINEHIVLLRVNRKVDDTGGDYVVAPHDIHDVDFEIVWMGNKMVSDHPLLKRAPQKTSPKPP